MRINLQDITDAIDMTTADTQYGLNRTTGEIVPLDETNEDLIALPDHREIDDYGCMERFIEKKTDGEAKEWLSNAIHGRGAFRMFRATLNRFDLTQEWYDFRDREHRFIAMDWCDENGIEYDMTRKVLHEEDEDVYEDDYYEEEDEPIVASSQPENRPLKFIRLNRDNCTNLMFLIAPYIAEITGQGEDLDGAEHLANEWAKSDQITIAGADHGRWIGFATVCFDSFGDASLTNLFVRKDCRRKTFGTQLFKAAEDCAKEKGCDSLIAKIDPKDDLAISFLASVGYNTLSTISLVKAPETDEPIGSIQVDKHRFQY